MRQVIITMPEAKFRSTKQSVQPARSIRSSEFAHEVLAFQPHPKEDINTKIVSKKNRINFIAFWPVALGLFLAGFAPEWQAMATQIGIWAVRFAFPLSLLATHSEIGMDGQTMPQIALYAQLPLDGLLTMLTLAHGKSLKSALAQLFLVHGICTFVLWLLTFAN
jgi:hypothetical protein